MSALQTTTPRLSLFQIESELLGLVDQREDALDRARAGEDVLDELAVVDGLIRDYVKAEVKKVDNIALAIKEFEARSLAKAKQAEELSAKSKRDADTAKRIKEFALAVLQDSGSKKEAGRIFNMTRQGNGGMQALTIAQADLVPETFQKVTVTCTRPTWNLIRKYLDRFWGDHSNITTDDLFARVRVESVPDTDSIRDVLESAEAKRKAILAAAEAAKVPATDQTVIEQLNQLLGVPGCKLEPRGEQLRIR